MMPSEYTQQADKFLADNGITFTTILIGNDCPMFCEDRGKDMNMVGTYPRRTHIHGKHYLATFSRAGKSVSFDFWNSYADEEHNANVWRKGGRRKVSAYDVLACLTKNNPGTFEDFCADFGYDVDSRRAEDSYRAVVNEWRKVRGFFPAESLEALQEIA